MRLKPSVICAAKTVVCSRIYRTQARSGAARFMNKPRRHEVAQAERVGIAAHLELEDFGIAPYVARTEYPIVLGRGQRVESEGRRRDESSGFRFAGRFPGVRLRPRPQSLGDARRAEAKRCTEAIAEAYPRILFGAFLSRRLRDFDFDFKRTKVRELVEGSSIIASICLRYTVNNMTIEGFVSMNDPSIIRHLFSIRVIFLIR